MSNTIQKYKDYVMTGFMKSVAPIAIERASGCSVWDEAGREYLDCFSGISVVNAGHNNPRVIAAAKAQMDKLVHCASYLYHVKPVADLGEKIAQIAPHGLTKTFFGNGGAEAIEGAMKLARLYTGKHEFIALHASFHGRSWGALSVTGNQGRKKRGGPYAAGVAFAPAPYVYRSQWPDDPDILVTAKGIADGFPLSAYTTRPEIAAAYKPGDHLSTFGGNPVSCAAALANIEFLEKENLPARATETGNYAMAKLRELQKDNPLIGEVRGLGLMIGVELVRDEKLTPASSEAEAIRDALLRQGVLVGVGGVYGNVVRFQPPLVITRQQIDQALEAFATALAEVAQPAHV